MLRRLRDAWNRQVLLMLEKQALALGQSETKRMLAANPTSLAEAEFSVFSQHGEDGVIQWLINKVPIENEIFVEFGVGDYRESNTRFLLLNNNWAGVILDGGDDHCRYVRKSGLSAVRRIRARQAFITRENINQLLKEEGLEGDIGLLSLDIDGMDYWVLEALDQVKPRILVTEYNAVLGRTEAVTLPYVHDFCWDGHSAYFGASLRAMASLADKKGYALVGVERQAVNAFFVRKDLLGGGFKALRVDEAWKDRRMGGGLVEGRFLADNGDAQGRVGLGPLQEV